MRLHRRIRMGYRSGAKKKSVKFIVVRVLFVILCAAAITLLSVLLGSYLKGKANEAENILASGTAEETSPPESIELFPDGVPGVSDADRIRVTAAHIDLTDIPADSVSDRLDSLSDVYNAVSVDIFSDSGQLIYLSQALLDYVGLDSENIVKLPTTYAVPGSNVASEDSEEDDDSETSFEIDVLENIKTLLSEASERSLRTSAVFKGSPTVLTDTAEALIQSEIDSVILGELCSFGFDEVIITGLTAEDETVSYDMLKSMISYLAILRKNSAELDIGVLLPASVYLVPQSASIIKTLSEYVDFLAISIDTDAAEQDEAYYSVYDDCHSLKGNFSVYNIRGVITNTDPDISSAIFAALRNLSAASTQFSVFVEDPSYVPEHIMDDSEETESEYISNDNAYRGDSYSEEEENSSDVGYE